jgi:biopolymer transport protein ExbD
MIKSRRAKRMERHHKKSKTPGLNLVAFMDIFTLLVFFLLVNSSSTQHIPSQKELKLPVSFSKVAPEDTLVIEITRTKVLVRGISVGTIEEILKSGDEVIGKLKDELATLSLQNATDLKEFKISIMGDENSSYELVRKILTTCQQANYTKIAFVAMQSTKPKAL